MKFAIGDIVELNQDVMFYDKGLIAQVTKIEEGNYGWVKVLNYKDKNIVGNKKHANLSLFKLVRRGGFHV